MASTTDSALALRVVAGTQLPQHEFSDLVDASEKRFYPLEIPIAHHQLRHYISATDDNVIYYASRNEIFTIKNGRRHWLASVDFQIQCLAAAHGWVCVGSKEGGRFAYRHFGSSARDEATGGAQVDDQIPFNLRPSARPGSPEGLRYLPHTQQAHRSDASSGPKPIFYKSVGTLIVNAITIERIQPKQPGSKPEIVALLSNNDYTVSVFSLDRMRVLKTLEFQYPMNHASVSADGSLLAACGDVNKVFFFRGVEVAFDKLEGRVNFDWQYLADPELPGFPAEDNCFSTAFSPDGRYCSVASETGMLAMYDISQITERMAEDDAIAQQYTTSRPGTHLSRPNYWAGAVRAVAFSPLSTNLMAYAEGSGRVCIADLKCPYRPPQVVEFLKNDPKNVRLELSDSSPDDNPDLDELFSNNLQRLGRPSNRSANNINSTDIDSAADMIEDAAQRSRFQELLRSYRRAQSPFSENASRMRSAESTTPHVQAASGTAEAGSATTEPAGVNIPPPPRRRSSIVLGSLGNAATNSSSTHPSSLAPIFPTTALSASPSRLGRSAESSSTTPPNAPQTGPPGATQDPWQLIEEAMNANQDTARNGARDALESQLRLLRDTRNSLEEARRSYIGESDLSRRSREVWRQQIRDNIARSEFAHVLRSTGTEETQGSQTLPRRSLSVSRVARRLRQNSNPRGSIEATLNDSHERLRELERDLEAIDREHATFTAHASRLWQGSNPSETRPTGQGLNNLTTSTLMSDLLNQQQSSLDRLGIRGDNLFDQSYHREMYHSSYVEGSNSPDELQLMGLAWAPDGSLLYVATTDGIFKLEVYRTTVNTFAAASQPM